MKYTKEQIIAAGNYDVQHAWEQERDRADKLAAELAWAHQFLEEQGLWSQFLSLCPPEPKKLLDAQGRFKAGRFKGKTPMQARAMETDS